MNKYEKCVRDCKMGIKALQNIRGCLQAFERLCDLALSDDHLLISSFFHLAVVRYSKPFVETDTGSGLSRYPTKHLKKLEKFSISLHEHILDLRNTLIAHDDFNYIEPRILKLCVIIGESEYQIPTSIVISNKCISHPTELDTLRKFKEHDAVVVAGVNQKLNEDISTLRTIALAHPEMAQLGNKYSKDYGIGHIGPWPATLTPPDFSNDDWLDSKVPDFSEIHHGFRYEEIKIKYDFHGPDRITLPDGKVIDIAPTKGAQ